MHMGGQSSTETLQSERLPVAQNLLSSKSPTKTRKKKKKKTNATSFFLANRPHAARTPPPRHCFTQPECGELVRGSEKPLSHGRLHRFGRSCCGRTSPQENKNVVGDTYLDTQDPARLGCAVNAQRVARSPRANQDSKPRII